MRLKFVIHKCVLGFCLPFTCEEKIFSVALMFKACTIRVGTKC